jgi:SAM-dependent methyltransferase
MRKWKEHFFRLGYGYADASSYPTVLRISARTPPIRKRTGQFMRFLEWKENGKLLDFGCGDGGFLLEARKWGWECYGLEPDPKAGCHSLNCEGIRLLPGGLDSLEVSDLQFDAIVLHHVIEHVDDVRRCLKVLSKALKPGGQLISISPNPNALGLTLAGKWWPALDPPRHSFIPSRRFLSSCCQETDLSFSTFTLHRNLASQYSCAVKSQTRDRIPVVKLKAQQVFLGAAGAVLDAAGLSRGDELVLVARRQPAGPKPKEPPCE